MDIFQFATGSDNYYDLGLRAPEGVPSINGMARNQLSAVTRQFCIIARKLKHPTFKESHF